MKEIKYNQITVLIVTNVFLLQACYSGEVAEIT